MTLFINFNLLMIVLLGRSSSAFMESRALKRIPSLQKAKSFAVGSQHIVQPAASPRLQQLFKDVVEKNPCQSEFHQAVEEVLTSLGPVIEVHPEYLPVLKVLIEPERIIQFRVPWYDDAGVIHVNRGFRVQFSNAIGAFKGGLRFHPSVTQSVLKFLGFEQVFKNSLTGLPLGGGKGGSDFDPKGKSESEVRRFCQSFMLELYRHIGADIDIPAGDIGVGGREIGYLFGSYRKVTNQFTGTITGKGVSYGGSLIRPEATGYGLVYFAREMLKSKGLDFNGRRVAISGSGNVAQYAAEKVLQLGGIPITLSDSEGFIYDPSGITREKLDWVMALKNDRRGRISEYVSMYPEATFTKANPNLPNALWSTPNVDVALPCATQNEIRGPEAASLVENGVVAVAEGANMPCDPAAVEVFQNAGVLFAPGKASNAGGVATSGLEMSQNSQRLSWTRSEVDSKLDAIMVNIHDTVSQTASKYGIHGNYVAGANIAGFIKVADAMLAQGLA